MKSRINFLYRNYYHSLINDVLSDSEWEKVKNDFDRTGLVWSIENLEQYHKKRNQKFVPKFSINNEELRTLKHFAYSMPTHTGSQILSVIKDLGLNPNRSTITRWFEAFGGFKKSRTYSSDAAFGVFGYALRYKGYQKRNYSANKGENQQQQTIEVQAIAS